MPPPLVRCDRQTAQDLVVMAKASPSAFVFIGLIVFIYLQDCSPRGTESSEEEGLDAELVVSGENRLRRPPLSVLRGIIRFIGLNHSRQAKIGASNGGADAVDAGCGMVLLQASPYLDRNGLPPP